MNAVTFPRGFRASGIACGLKESGKRDLALIVSDVPASVAGMFTQNSVVAAPVTLSRTVRHPWQRPRDGDQLRQRERLHGRPRRCRRARDGDAHRRRALGCEADEVLVASTGIIGRPLRDGAAAHGHPARGRRALGGGRRGRVRRDLHHRRLPEDRGGDRPARRRRGAAWCDGQGRRHDPARHGDDDLPGHERRRIAAARLQRLLVPAVQRSFNRSRSTAARPRTTACSCSRTARAA